MDHEHFADLLLLDVLEETLDATQDVGAGWVPRMPSLAELDGDEVYRPF